jgi:Cu-Zn family superoxide dismutase
MRYLFISAVLAVALVMTAAAEEKKVVELKDAKGESVGTATLQNKGSGVRMKMDLKGLPPGEHVAHFHQNAKCDAPDFKSAGPHFNPESKKHGLQNPEGHHAGDLPNFAVKADGKAKVSLTSKDVTLGEGSHSLFSNGGTALVIHAKADDMKTDPAGNAGDRIACGLITK